VHHKFYIDGKLPWEYDYSECATLCKGCHAREHGIIMPDSGWILLGSDDLGDLIGNCELCGQDLRYLCAITHPKWTPMAVGTNCCDKLTMTDTASEYHRIYINERKSAAAFMVSKKWTQNGKEWSIKRKGIAIKITNSENAFLIQLDDAQGKIAHATLDEAKLAVFQLIQSGEAAEYLEQRKRRRSSC
jgi:hypothetical protein